MRLVIFLFAAWLLVLAATTAGQSRAFIRDCSNAEAAGTWRLVSGRDAKKDTEAETEVSEVVEVRANGQLFWFRREPSGHTTREGFQYYIRGRAITLKPPIAPSGRWIRCQLEGNNRLVVFAVPVGEGEEVPRRLELYRVGVARP